MVSVAAKGPSSVRNRLLLLIVIIAGVSMMPLKQIAEYFQNGDVALDQEVKQFPKDTTDDDGDNSIILDQSDPFNIEGMEHASKDVIDIHKEGRAR